MLTEPCSVQTPPLPTPLLRNYVVRSKYAPTSPPSVPPRSLPCRLQRAAAVSGRRRRWMCSPQSCRSRRMNNLCWRAKLSEAGRTVIDGTPHCNRGGGRNITVITLKQLFPPIAVLGALSALKQKKTQTVHETRKNSREVFKALLIKAIYVLCQPPFQLPWKIIVLYHVGRQEGEREV